MLCRAVTTEYLTFLNIYLIENLVSAEDNQRMEVSRYCTCVFGIWRHPDSQAKTSLTLHSRSSRKRTLLGSRKVSTTGADRLRECVNTEFV